MNDPAVSQPPALAPEHRACYARLIEQRFGIRLSSEQMTLLPDIVAKLLVRVGCSSVDELYARLESSTSSHLADMLAADLTVGETYFFRISPQIEALRSIVLPDLLRNHAGARRLGVWSAGCSTGEEPYTLAMLFREALPAPGDWRIDLLATDINDRALECAREGLYTEWSFRETPTAIRQSYFEPEGARWRLNESVRRLVHFERLNLMSDPFPSPGPNGPTLQLILCRNVTIYFGAATTQLLYQRLAEALVPGGWLVLGPSDPVPVQPGPLKSVPVRGAILWRKGDPPVDSMQLETGVLTRGTARAHGTDLAPALRHRGTEGSNHHGASGNLAQPAGARLADTGPGKAAGRNGAGPVARAAGRAGRLEVQDAHGAAHATGSRNGTDTHGPAQVKGTGDLTPLTRAEHLVRTQPLDFEGHLLLGMIHLGNGAVQPAIESLRRAAFLDGTNGLIQFSLGQAYARNGDPDRARAAFSQARRLLAAVPPDQPVPGGGDMTVDELRYAIDMHLASPADAGGV